MRQPATTVCGDPRITARNHHDEGSQGKTPKSTAQVRAGDYDGTEPIKLTIEEGLILQSFDPSYPVQGTKSKKWEQIGNAIPPLLAKAVLGGLIQRRMGEA
jgi:DNA (cytosine-5)-methyltransferase 1